MKNTRRVCLALILAVSAIAAVRAQENSAPEREQPLVLTHTVPLEGVKGRFDHFAQGSGKLFVSELGNDSVAVISLFGIALQHTITGVPGPQGLAFSPEANKL